MDSYADEAKAKQIIGARLSSNVTRERSAIEAELAELHDTIDSLQEMVKNLGNRVSPISYQEPTRDETRALPEQKGSSEFYHNLYSAKNKTVSVIELVADITRRLEV